jgi:hypothetical protein
MITNAEASSSADIEKHSAKVAWSIDHQSVMMK